MNTDSPDRNKSPLETDPPIGGLDAAQKAGNGSNGVESGKKAPPFKADSAAPGGLDAGFDMIFDCLRVMRVGFQGFVDAGDDDCGVACELAGGVDGVAIPGAFGKACGIEECGFGGAEGVVECGWV